MYKWQTSSNLIYSIIFYFLLQILCTCQKCIFAIKVVIIKQANNKKKKKKKGRQKKINTFKEREADTIVEIRFICKRQHVVVRTIWMAIMINYMDVSMQRSKK